MCLLLPKQGSITAPPKLINPSPSFKTQSEAPSPAPCPFLHPQLPPLSHPFISHWVMTTGQDLSPVTGRDFLRVQFVFLQALELVSS